jgi:glycerol uptake facilitator-like aquaporin
MMIASCLEKHVDPLLLNPAMCLAQWEWGNITGVDFVCLSLAEFAGAFVGRWVQRGIRYWSAHCCFGRFVVHVFHNVFVAGAAVVGAVFQSLCSLLHCMCIV